MADLVLWERLQALKGLLVRALATAPAVREVRLQGSLARWTADGYSDVDLQLASVNPAMTLASLPVVLSQVGPIEAVWPIVAAREPWAATILWRNESYYHRLDLCIEACEGVSWAQTGPADVPYWKTVRGQSVPPTVLTPGTPGHFAVDQLIGGIRYLKARRRGHGFTCWRFATALVDWLASMSYQAEFGLPHLGRKLTTWEYVDLDRRLGSAEVARVLGLLDFSTAAGMDRGVLWLLGRIADQCSLEAGPAGHPFPKPLADKLLTFIEREVDG